MYLVVYDPNSRSKWITVYIRISDSKNGPSDVDAARQVHATRNTQFLDTAVATLSAVYDLDLIVRLFIIL